MQTPFIFQLEGRPLSELGLENAVILHADGTIEQLKGFIVQEGGTIVKAIEDSLPEGSSLFLSRDDLVAHSRKKMKEIVGRHT